MFPAKCLVPRRLPAFLLAAVLSITAALSAEEVKALSSIKVMDMGGDGASSAITAAFRQSNAWPESAIKLEWVSTTQSEDNSSTFTLRNHGGPSLLLGFYEPAEEKDAEFSPGVIRANKAALPVAQKILNALNAELAIKEAQPFQTLVTELESGGSGPIILVELGTGEEPLSRRTRRLRRALWTVHANANSVTTPCPPPMPTAENSTLRVAIYDSEGTGGSGVKNLVRIVNGMAASSYELLCPEDIRDGALHHYDVGLFPGGSGKAQAFGLQEQGREEVKSFVARGGGYVGICAGAYLATCRLDPYLAMVKSYHQLPWRLGGGQVKLELTATGQEILGRGEPKGLLDVRYNNGPMFYAEKEYIPESIPDLPDFEVLAHFRSPVEGNEEESQVMIDQPAIVAAPYQNGRAVLVSPHPEATPELDWLLQNAILWSIKRQPSSEQPGG